MAELRPDFGRALPFISHDLHVVRHRHERAIVMYLGRVVEERARASLIPRADRQGAGWRACGTRRWRTAQVASHATALSLAIGNGLLVFK